MEQWKIWYIKIYTDKEFQKVCANKVKETLNSGEKEMIERGTGKDAEMTPKIEETEKVKMWMKTTEKNTEVWWY